jgi:hypothetical protein
MKNRQVIYDTFLSKYWKKYMIEFYPVAHYRHVCNRMANGACKIYTISGIYKICVPSVAIFKNFCPQQKH